jgi:bifunctional DNA-binding transcriptional regulator/antitoxin component of YhaV-PrlF toxin-antitoxin module
VSAERRFRATLAASERGGGRWVEVPFDPREAFGEARPPVVGTINGTEYRSRLAVYGGRTYLGLTREIRDATGIEVGDDVEVVLRRDDEPRQVTVPAELVAALTCAEPEVRARFDALAFTHRREFAQWVDEAKRSDTRERRAAEAVEMLRDGVKHPGSRRSSAG